MRGDRAGLRLQRRAGGGVCVCVCGGGGGGGVNFTLCIYVSKTASGNRILRF